MSLYPFGVLGNPGYPLGLGVSDSPLQGTGRYTRFTLVVLAETGMRNVSVVNSERRVEVQDAQNTSP